MKNHSVILLLITSIYLPFAVAQEQPLEPKNCYIQIKSKYKTGEIRTSLPTFFFQSKDQCIKMKNILSDNFSPSEISKVETKMEWTGK